MTSSATAQLSASYLQPPDRLLHSRVQLSFHSLASVSPRARFSAERRRGDAEPHSSGGGPPRARGWAADALGVLHWLRWPARALAAWGALLLLARSQLT